MKQPNRRTFLGCTATACWAPTTFGLGAAAALAGCERRESPAAGESASASAPASAPFPASSSSSVAPARRYKLGLDPSYAPFEYFDDHGRIVGFDVDLLQAIAQRSGFEVEIVNTPWTAMFDLLLQGERAILASAIAVTQERAQRMAFSRPYFESSQLILADGSLRVARLADLKQVRIGVQAGSVGDEEVSRLLGGTSPAVRRFESVAMALKELESGGVSAVVADSGPIRHHVHKTGAARFRVVVDDRLPRQSFAIAVRPGETGLLRSINQSLEDLTADGSLAALTARYFGDAPVAAASRSPAAASRRASTSN